MSVYCVYLGEDVYFGSTKQGIRRRENRHNSYLKTGKNLPLYNKARDLGIDKIELCLLYEGDDYKQVEHDFIVNEKCINLYGAVYDRQRYLKKHCQNQKNYIKRKREKLSQLSL